MIENGYRAQIYESIKVQLIYYVSKREKRGNIQIYNSGWRNVRVLQEHKTTKKIMQFVGYSVCYVA